MFFENTLEINDDEMTDTEEKDATVDTGTEVPKKDPFDIPKQTNEGLLRIGLVTDTHVASDWSTLRSRRTRSERS